MDRLISSFHRLRQRGLPAGSGDVLVSELGTALSEFGPCSPSALELVQGQPPACTGVSSCCSSAEPGSSPA